MLIINTKTSLNPSKGGKRYSFKLLDFLFQTNCVLLLIYKDSNKIDFALELPGLGWF